MSVTPLERILIDTCIDIASLREAQSDLTGVLERAGVSGLLTEHIASGRGSSISAAVRATRPQPSPAEIMAYAKERALVDPIFAMRLRDEPRPTLERAFLVRFPASRSVESLERGGLIEVLVVDEARAVEALPLEATVDPEFNDIVDVVDMDNVDVDIDNDADVDVEVDVDVDVEVDVLDNGDTDIDVDNGLGRTATPRVSARWTGYWQQRRAHWNDLQHASAR